MNTTCPTGGVFDHMFGQAKQKPQERRIIIITGVTVAVMVAEIIAGLLTGSMALLADGVHMGTHALALGLAAAAYIFARRYAGDRRFSLGTGKAGELTGFASALMLGFAAVLLFAEAVERLLAPQPIAYGEALVVAVIGLVVNLASALGLMGGGHAHCGTHNHDHGHSHSHDHAHNHNHHAHDHKHDHDATSGHPAHQDNNLRAAFLHIMADAVTSVAAIIALLLGWYFGLAWLDPLVAGVASCVILVWAFSLGRDTGRVLLDAEAPDSVRREIQLALEKGGDSRVADLHIWSVGPGALMVMASVVTHHDRQPDDYKAVLPRHLGIHHPIIEVQRCHACRL